MASDPPDDTFKQWLAEYEDSIPLLPIANPSHPDFFRGRSDVLCLPWRIVTSQTGDAKAVLFVPDAVQKLSNVHYQGGYNEALSALQEFSDMRIVDSDKGRYISVSHNSYMQHIAPHIFIKEGSFPLIGPEEAAPYVHWQKLNPAEVKRDRFAELTNGAVPNIIFSRIKSDLFAIPREEWKHSITLDSDIVILPKKGTQQHYAEQLSRFITTFYPPPLCNGFTIKTEGEDIVLSLPRKAYNQMRDDIAAENSKQRER